jgi:hypothetical protein
MLGYMFCVVWHQPGDEVTFYGLVILGMLGWKSAFRFDLLYSMIQTQTWFNK